MSIIFLDRLTCPYRGREEGEVREGERERGREGGEGGREGGEGGREGGREGERERERGRERETLGTYVGLYYVPTLEIRTPEIYPVTARKLFPGIFEA